jgi:hypothetical protein
MVMLVAVPGRTEVLAVMYGVVVAKARPAKSRMARAKRRQNGRRCAGTGTGGAGRILMKYELRTDSVSMGCWQQNTLID